MKKLRPEDLLPEENYAEIMDGKVMPFLEEHMEDLTIEAEDGAPIHACIFRNPGSEALVCICHGFTEFAAKHGENIYMFYRAGYSVAICEHRGHGWSARELDNLSKVHIDSYDTYVSDFRHFTCRMKKEFPGQERLLFAHSMGGCVGALYLERYPGDYSGAILSSPMLDIDSGVVPKPAAVAFGEVMHLMHRGDRYLGSQDQDYPGNETFETSCCDSRARWEYWKQYRERDPYLQTTSGTVRWMTASLKAVPRALREASDISVPVLVCQAGADNMVKPKGQVKFAQQVPLGRIRVFVGSRHEIFNGTPENRLDFWNTVLGFFGGVLKIQSA